jgi:hypothetical protein
VNRAGVLNQVASGVPATDYAGGVLRGTTVEPSATNLLQRSEEFDNSVWVKAGTIPATVTPNTGIAPDGTMTMDTINVPDGQSHIYQNMNTSTAGVEYTVSFWYLGTAGETVRLRHVSNTVVHVKTVTFTGELQRETLTFITGTSFNFVFPADRRAGGNATSFQCWGAQLETGSVATSYIKTEGSAQTRNADVITKTGLGSVLPQTEGWVYAEVDLRNLGAGFRRILVIDNGDENNATYLRLSNIDNRIQLVSFNVTVQALIATSPNQSGIKRILGTFKNDEFKLFVNGVLIGSDTSGTIPALRSILRIGSSNNTTDSTHFLNDPIHSYAIGSGAITDASAIQLTTL